MATTLSGGKLAPSDFYIYIYIFVNFQFVSSLLFGKNDIKQSNVQSV